MSSARLSRVQQAAALSDIDKRISDRIFSNGSCVPRWLYKLLEYGGDGFVWLAITVSAVLLPSTPMTTRALWSNFLLGLIVDLILVGVVKGVCRRKRPVYNNMKDFLVVVSVDNFSFPSGHSSRVAYIAVFTLVFLPSLGPWLHCAIIMWALITALSRAAMGRHYAGDVLAGIFVGFVNVLLLTKGQLSNRSSWVDVQTTQKMYASAFTRLQEIAAMI